MKTQKLKELAQQATPWPWKWFTSNSHNRLSSVPGGNDGDVISAFKAADGAACVSISHDDMAFIEAAHPGAVIELIERLEAADKDGREYAILAGTNAARAEKAERERDELRERLSLVREQRDAELNKSTQLEAELARRDAAAGEPEFYVRYRSDGGYEGPLHKDATEECRKQSWSPLYTAAPPAASVNYPVIPEGWIPMPGKLTAENGAKAALSGDFAEHKVINCPECFGDDECESCDGSGRIKVEVIVSWSTIKAIWEKGAEHFATAPAPGGDCG